MRILELCFLLFDGLLDMGRCHGPWCFALLLLLQQIGSKNRRASVQCGHHTDHLLREAVGTFPRRVVCLVFQTVGLHAKVLGVRDFPNTVADMCFFCNKLLLKVVD
ncbi:hypothetical protein V6N13_090344 [Hibiscus sabdariffa]